MVWEQEASLVIMLTTTVERGRVRWTLLWLLLAPFSFYPGFQDKQTRNIELKIPRNLVAAFAHSSGNYFGLRGSNATNLVLNSCLKFLGKMSSLLARRRRNSYVWRPGNYLHENSRLLAFVHLQGNVRHRLQGTCHLQWLENKTVTSGQWYCAWLSLRIRWKCSGQKYRWLCPQRLKKNKYPRDVILAIFTESCLLFEFSEPAKPSCCSVTIHCLARPRWVGLTLPSLHPNTSSIFIVSECSALHRRALK